MRYTVSGADTLQKRVTEASGRTIPQSTIDDVVRALGLTAKVAERVHPGRDPIASAQVRQDVNSYPLLCVTNLDATHIAPEDYIRPVGRAPRGKKARLRANAIRHRPSESVRLMAGETTGRRPAGGSMVSVTIGSVTIGNKQVKLGASKVSGLV